MYTQGKGAMTGNRHALVQGQGTDKGGADTCTGEGGSLNMLHKCEGSVPDAYRQQGRKTYVFSYPLKVLELRGH